MENYFKKSHPVLWGINKNGHWFAQTFKKADTTLDPPIAHNHISTGFLACILNGFAARTIPLTVLKKLSIITQEELLSLLTRGDRLAFKQLYTSNYCAVLSHALKLTKSRPLAEDVVHDVFLKIWEAKDTLDNVRHLRSYLLTICKNMALNLLARASREAEILDNLHLYMQASEPDPEVELEQQNHHLLQEAIERLPVQRRKVFRLCKIDGNSYETVAAQMGISPGTVNDHIVKGTKAIKKFLSQAVKAEHMEIRKKLSYQ